MGRISVGSVVFVRFPFSDLAQAKLRPAVVLADVGLDDRIHCQVTSNAFSEAAAVEIAADDFHVGSLRKPSFARPGQLFTAHLSLISSVVGELGLAKFHQIVDAIIELLRTSKRS